MTFDFIVQDWQHQWDRWGCFLLHILSILGAISDRQGCNDHSSRLQWTVQSAWYQMLWALYAMRERTRCTVAL